MVTEEFETDNLEEIRDFIARADYVDGPDELYDLVSEMWPELLHKVKPPRHLMH
jgi:hypothetical protein